MSTLSLKAWQLKAWAFLTGLPSSGTKGELSSLLQRSLDKPSRLTSEKTRVVSVDMGIRNLAFCVVEVPCLRSHSQIRKTPLTVKSWTRMDLLEASKRTHSSEVECIETRLSPEATPRKPGRQMTSVLDKTAFAPSALSRTAYTLTSDLLKYEPDMILIERQRFRSGGAAAIQEWTVRVNMLESMLWACLETLRSQSGSRSDPFPKVLDISPARVANFWLAGSDVPLRPPVDLFETGVRPINIDKASQHGRKKVDKKDKVALARSWLSQDSDEVLVDLEGEAAETAKSFSMKRGLSQSTANLTGGKLDDLADCLLQAVAWVRWEENRLEIRDMYNRASKQ